MNDLLIWLANFLPEGWLPQNPDEVTSWAIAGVLIAFATLIVSAIATLFTVLGYFKKPAVADAASGNENDQKHTQKRSVSQSVTGNENTVIQIGGNVQGNMHVPSAQAESGGINTDKSAVNSSGNNH